MSILGIDLGTSGVRAIVFSADGDVLGAASRPFTLHRDAPGRVELDPAEVLHATESAVAQVAADPATRCDPPQALAFAVLGEAVLPIGADGDPLARIAVSMDARGHGAAAELDTSFGADRFTEITGQPLHGMFSVFKIAAGGEGWEQAAGYRCVGDFITERWTGRAAIDASQAARTGMYDVEKQRWSEDVITAVAGVAPWLHREALPDPACGGDVVGELTPAAAERLGIPAGIPVVSGAHDQAAAYLGGGGIPGVSSVISFGSSDCLNVGTASRPTLAPGTGFASYLVLEGCWVTLAGTAAGGWALEWLASMLGGTVDGIFSHLADEPPSLLMLPYLAGSGTLDNDPNARGTIHGLTLETSSAQLARAVVEGAGFEFAKIIAAFTACGVDVGRLRVTGSGAHNASALNARANAAGRALIPVTADASARGAAILAARGAGIFAPGLAAEPSPVAAAQHPVPELRDWYDAQRTRYCDLFDATRSITFAPFDITRTNQAHEKESTK